MMHYLMLHHFTSLQITNLPRLVAIGLAKEDMLRF